MGTCAVVVGFPVTVPSPEDTEADDERCGDEAVLTLQTDSSGH